MKMMKTVKHIIKLLISGISIMCGMILLKPIINLIVGFVLLVLGSALFISTLETENDDEQIIITKT